MNASPADLATTLNIAAIGSDFAAFAQIGDGVMGFSFDGDSGEWHVAIEPETGEFAGETFFLTSEDWSSHVRFRRLDRSPERVFITTDGLRPILYDSRARSIHARFVDPLFAALTNDAGTDSTNSERLRHFLESKRVSSACDDDLTLILARRTENASPCTSTNRLNDIE